MYKFYRMVVLGAVAASVGACSDGQIMAPDADSDLARAAAMGFDVTGAVNRGDYLLVEGDILLKKSDLPPVGAGRDPRQPNFQYRTTNRVAYTYYYDLRVDYSQVESQNADWAAAIDQAMTAWNQIPGSEARLIKWEPGQFYGPHITITFGSCGSTNAIACASFPSSSGEPGSYITIAQPGHWAKLYTIAHELGHTLGLRHTNWNNRTCVNQNGQPYLCQESSSPEGALHIPNTPTSTFGGAQSDPASVMNAVVQSWNGFSFYDRVAVRYLFPGGRGPAVQTTLNGGTPTAQWSPMLDAVSYDVYYQEWENQPDPVFGSWPAQVYRYVGTTTGTSLTDWSRSHTTTQCYDFYNRGYVVKARFADGTVTGYGELGCSAA